MITVTCVSVKFNHSDIEWHGASNASVPDWSQDSRFVAFTLKDVQHSQYIYVAFNAFWDQICTIFSLLSC